MNHEALKTLVDYHYWALDRLMAALEPLASEEYRRDLGSSFRSIHETLVHLYSAEWVWYSRWQGAAPTAPIPSEAYPDLASLRRAWQELEAQVRAFVEGLGEGEIDRVFDYRLMNGAAASSRLFEMLQHVVNHGSYHRGQVTTMLRQLGAKPSQSMDLIGYYRARQG